ncbi:hypothetical protein HYR99_06595 [Candidatus Poribacteria bacterium]|nr:hypothetical protein [Candidatus Poribacteria bacterium]
MEGFVTPGLSTHYARILQPLESAVETGWAGGQAVFYQFGTRVEPLPERGYLRAQQPIFYQNPQINKETHIEQVIDRADTGHLTVIVTDLFQHEADVVLLMAKLKEKYIRNNLAVGVLGLRSQFDGIVYDVDIRADKFKYQSGEKPENFRPFYVLMLGKHADVAHYFEQFQSSGLSSGLSFLTETKFVIFSRHLANPLSSFKEASVDSIDKMVQVGDLVTATTPNKRMKQFRVRGNPATASFAATLKYTPLPYTMEFTELESEVVARQYEQKDKLAKSMDELEESEEAKQILVIEQIASNGGVKFHAKLTPPSLSSDRIYIYDVTLRPKESAYRMPAWFSAWDMGTAQDGSRTLNLNRFLSDLWRATVQIHHPKVARFYCYVKKG